MVTERLRIELMNGKIEPGSRMPTSQLATRLGVSHIPIREALRRLEVEGLVTTSPQRPATAVALAPEDLRALYDLRRLIEVPVAWRAAERATGEHAMAAENALSRLEQADLEGGDFFDCHRDFHAAVLAAGCTDWIERILDQLWRSAQRYVGLAKSAGDTMAHARRDHKQMIECLRCQDGAAMAAVISSHLTNTENALLAKYFARHPAD
jgi:DNA-binding GntR family transcriptional regulator